LTIPAAFLFFHRRILRAGEIASDDSKRVAYSHVSYRLLNFHVTFGDAAEMIDHEIILPDASGHGLLAAMLVRDVVTGLRMGLEKEMKMVHTIKNSIAFCTAALIPPALLRCFTAKSSATAICFTSMPAIRRRCWCGAIKCKN
jgi:hypothetical protein